MRQGVAGLEAGNRARGLTFAACAVTHRALLCVQGARGGEVG
jgi:hypothetical protein